MNLYELEQLIYNNNRPTQADGDALKNAKGKEALLSALDKFKLPKELRYKYANRQDNNNNKQSSHCNRWFFNAW